jgi:hypothetical protein
VFGTGAQGRIRDRDTATSLDIATLVGCLDRKDAMSLREGSAQRDRIVHIARDDVKALGGEMAGCFGTRVSGEGADPPLAIREKRSGHRATLLPGGTENDDCFQ